MTSLTVTPAQRILEIITDTGRTIEIAAPTAPSLEVVRVGIQGPPGTGAEDALLRANRLSEFDSQAARTAARSNLELETIDLGTFN